MSDFIKGLELSELFFREAVQPLLRRFDRSLNYSAGLLGFGSDVLGYDTPLSRDHMWGPRLYLFLPQEDKRGMGESLHGFLSQNLPPLFRGYPVNFSGADREGVRRMEENESGKVNHLVMITTVEEMAEEYLGYSSGSGLKPSEWLTMGEHRLLAFTSGKIFHDDLGLEAIRESFSFYPADVHIFLMASLWQMIAEKEAFVGRCGEAGDDLGSRLNAAALVQYLMRLSFLWEKIYAPYGKWFATGLSRLEAAKEMGPLLEGILKAYDWREREDFLCRAYMLAGEWQNRTERCRSVPPLIRNYYGRPFRVIFAERYADALSEAINDPYLRKAERIGSVSHFSDVCQLYDRVGLTKKLTTLYE